MDEYLATRHITVVYEPRRALDLDQWLAGHGVQRRFAVMVPGFADLPAFIHGSDLLASAEPPMPCPPLPMYMIWHARHQHDAAHRWLRGSWRRSKRKQKYACETSATAKFKIWGSGLIRLLRKTKRSPTS